MNKELKKFALTHTNFNEENKNCNCLDCRNSTSGISSHCFNSKPFIPSVESKEKCECENYHHNKCPNFMKNPDNSTQEPMEWNETIEDEFIDFWDHNKCMLGLGSYSSDVTQFWLNKIKQAEERHNQDCTREEWGRASEREKLIKEIATIKRWVATIPDYTHTEWEDEYVIRDKDLQLIITNQ